ncbi:MAG: hypothetical protein IJA98_04395 [Bacteroidaceae bacterium]|nr:hypothetical protein [Bacteroidaceae bacterium]
MRYRLAHSKEIKRNRWNKICPICKQPKFSPYIDTVTNEPIAPKECGRCCREKSCAYHMTPSEWFKEHPTEKREWLPREQYVELMRQRRREAEQAREQTKENCPSETGGVTRSFRGLAKCQAVPSEGSAVLCATEDPKGAECSIDETERRGYEVKEYCKRMNDLCHKSRSDRNNLSRWLCTQFPEEQVAEVLARYRTGSTRDGRIIYWQIDEYGQVRAGKVMAYDLDGHRKKDGKGNVCWVHSMKIDGIRFDEMLAPQCLFGLHLLNDNVGVNENLAPRCVQAPSLRGRAGGEAAIVESEKTALIMSLVCPDKVWLATGGKANFKESMLAPLLGHEVAVYPDADALHDWYTRAVEMNRTLGTHLHIPTGYYNLMDHDEARREGWDLADILLREE